MFKSKLAPLFIVTTLIVVISLYALTLGTQKIPVSEIISYFFGGGSKGIGFVLMEIRLPRVLTAILTGALLSLSGLIIQNIIKNPLAAPDVIGINSGASVGAVLWIILGLNSSFQSVATYSGGIIVAALVYALSYKKGVNSQRLILVGIGLNALCNAVISYLIIKGNIDIASKAYRWMTGSLYTTSWNEIVFMMLSLIIFTPIIIYLIKPLQIMMLGDVTSRSVGINVEGIRIFALLLGTLLSATAVSVTGPIGFVSLIVPHISRMFIKKLSVLNITLTAVIGSLLLLISDILAQHLFTEQLPVGVVISTLGAPYFLYLLVSRKRGF